jgi:hypothetical protein
MQGHPIVGVAMRAAPGLAREHLMGAPCMHVFVYLLRTYLMQLINGKSRSVCPGFRSLYD